jgi:hypothetical protein
MHFENKAFSNLRIEEIGDKRVYITDRHQYVMPVWVAYSNDIEKPLELVSIDFHPDTNPPFWQEITLKMSMDNREEDQNYFDELLHRRIERLNRYDLDGIVSCVDRLNNDEHINTAMYLGVLKDYHMLNCMDEHHYERGTHYLIDEAYYGLLEDDMFRSVGFELPDQPFILDIDLDYFMRQSNFLVKKDAFIQYLVQKASVITVARSVKYFEYLKKEAFSIEACEQLLLDLIQSYLD